MEALIDAEPNRLDATFRRTLYHHTTGNPLFVVELLRGLQERGDLVQDEAGRWTEGATLDWEQLPARVEAVVAERLERLSPEWQATLAVASVEGEIFTAEVVARTQGLDEGEIIRRLSGTLSKRQNLLATISLRCPLPESCAVNFSDGRPKLYGGLSQIRNAPLCCSCPNSNL